MAIMEGLIEDGFLVVAVDFKGGRRLSRRSLEKPGQRLTRAGPLLVSFE